MKLIPDSNSPNKYNNGLQYIVNTMVTIAVTSLAITGVIWAYSWYNDLSVSRDFPTLCTCSICYENAYVDSNYDTDRNDLETVRHYTRNYGESNQDTGIVITNEMLKAMSEENNLLRENYDIRGFHLYFADKTTGGGTPSIVFVPIGQDYQEFAPDNYRVLEVSERVCAPCPLLCDDYGL